MALDPNISMGVQVPNTAAPINNYVDQQRAGQQNDADVQLKAQQAHLAAAEAFNQHLQGLSTQEQIKLHAQIAGAAGLQPFLDKGDTDGAINYIKSMPFNVDAETKQQALGMLMSNDPAQLQQLQHYTKSLTLAGQVYGILPDTTFAQYQNMDPQGQKDFGAYKMASFGGRNASIAEMNMLNQDPATANLPLAQKLQMVNRKLGTNLTVDANGKVQGMDGAASAEAGMAGAKKAGEASAEAGVKYEQNLGQQADASLIVHRQLQEARQVGSTFNEGTLQPAKEAVGAWLEGIGVPADTVTSMVGNVGDMQTLGKITSQLASSSIKNISNRGTNLDLTTFLRANPNGAQTPESFNQLLSIMDRDSMLNISKQHAYNQEKQKPGFNPANYQNFDTSWNQQGASDATKEPIPGRGSEVPPVDGAKKAPDGNWYVPDPSRQGKYLRVDQ